MHCRSMAANTWFAIRQRCAPAAIATRNWVTLATVMPQAPASNCWRKSCGDMLVLPCGARPRPWALAKSCIQLKLRRIGSRRMTANGSGRSPRRTFQPCAAICDRRKAGLLCGKPLNEESISGSRKSATPIVRLARPRRCRSGSHRAACRASPAQNRAESRAQNPAPR